MVNETRRPRALSVLAMLAMTAALLVVVPALTSAQAPPDRRLANTTDPVQASIDISTEFFTANDPRVSSIIVGRSDVFADNLGGSSLAGVLGTGPLLLNPTTMLDSRIQAEITRVLPAPRPCAGAGDRGQVILLGGVAALSQQVENSIRALGYCTTRLAGAGRVETSVEIARLFTPTLTSPRTIFLARDNNPADSAAAGGLAARRGVPILVNPVATLHPAIEQFIRDFQITNVVLLGGTAALSQDVENRLNALGATVSRLAGATRDDTSAVIAREFTNPTPTTVGLVNGFNEDGWTYSLTAGAVGARENLPVVYVNTTGVGTPVGSYLCDTAPGEIISVGPTAAIPSTTSDAARTQANCAGTPGPTPPPITCTAFAPVPAVIHAEDFTVPAGFNAINRVVQLHAGDVVTITASTNNGQDPFLLLEDPAGNNIATNDDVAPGDVTAQISLQVRQTGGYLIETTDLNGQSNDVSLLVESAPGPGAIELANEVRTIAPNATQDLSFPVTRGERLRVNVLNLSTVDPVVDILDPNAALLATDDDSGFELESLVSTPVFDDGTHVVSVRDLTQAGGCVQVVVHVYPTLPTAFSSRTLTLPPNANGPIGDAVDLLPSERVTFVSFDQNGTTDPTIELLDPANNSLGFDDDGGGFPNSLLQLILNTDGLHMVEFGNLTSNTGSALTEMLVEHRPGAFNVISDSVTLTGVTPTSRTVELRAGELFVLDTTADDPGAVDPIVDIFDPNSNLVSNDDDSGFFLDSRNVLQVLQTGTYRIDVRDLNGNGGGVALTGSVLS